MSNAVRVSVIVPVTDVGDRLGEIVRSVDAQDLPYHRYQVIFVVAGPGDTTSSRLHELVDHRPNVTVVSAPDESSARRQAVHAADGDYLLALGSRDRLHPWALRVLADRAAETGSDVVLARSAGAGPVGFMPDTLSRPWAAENVDAASALLAPVALIRREIFTGISQDGGWRSMRARLVAGKADVDVLPDVPVAVGAGPAGGQTPLAAWHDAVSAADELPGGPIRETFMAAHLAALLRRTPRSQLGDLAADVVPAVRQHAKSADPTRLPPAVRDALAIVTDGATEPSTDADRAALESAADVVAGWAKLRVRARGITGAWQDGAVQLDGPAELTTEGTLPAGIGEVTLDVLVREVGSSVVYRVPADVRTGDAEGSFRLSARIDPATAALGSPLFNGFWQIMLRVRGSGSDAPATARLPYLPLGNAVVDGVPIATYNDDGQLRLDVGATKHGIFGSYRPADTSISESAAGSLLTIRLPGLAARGDARLSGHLYQGSFPLPATLCATDGTARIECYVSGLAGSSDLAARFPPAIRQSLGLRLRIGPAGDIAIETRPKTPAKPPAAPAEGAMKPPGQQASTSEGSSANRSGVKALLRPAFRRLPAPVRRRVRRAYRALTK